MRRGGKLTATRETGLREAGISSYTRGNEGTATWGVGLALPEAVTGVQGRPRGPCWGRLRQEWGGVKMRKGFTLVFAIIPTGLSSQSELDCHTPHEIIYDFK